MADIKMCDKCGAMFNPRGDWQSLTAVTFLAGDDGRQDRYDSVIELCGACSIDPRKAQTATPSALGTGRQLVDEGIDLWRDPDGSLHLKRGAQWIGPFSSRTAALTWYRGESGSDPVDADEEARS